MSLPPKDMICSCSEKCTEFSCSHRRPHRFIISICIIRCKKVLPCYGAMCVKFLGSEEIKWEV
jgi:hypothetical protein